MTGVKLGQPVAFKATRVAAKTIGASLADVVHDTEAYDYGSNFNTTTGVFTAPYAGVYHFDTNLEASATANNRAVVQFVCSTAGTFIVSDASVTTARKISGGMDVLLAASETVKVQALCANNTDVADPETFFTGHLVGRTD